MRPRSSVGAISELYMGTTTEAAPKPKRTRRKKADEAAPEAPADKAEAEA